MSRSVRSFCTAIAVSGGIALGLLAADVDKGHSQTKPENYEAVTRIMDELRAARQEPDHPDDPKRADQPVPDERFSQKRAVDYSAPSLALPRAREALQRVRANASNSARLRLRNADRALERAWLVFAGGIGREPHEPVKASGTEHLFATQEELLAAAKELASAKGNTTGLTEALQADVAAVSRRIAKDVYKVTVRSGVSNRKLRPIENLFDLAARAEDDEDYVAAIKLYGASTVLAGGTINFDIDQFEQNIRDGLDGEAIGYTYAITLFDAIHVSDAVGFARLPADLAAGDPPVAQSPGREMLLASVSKTLTTILLFQIFELSGVSVDDPIGPWLPPDWDLGEGVAAQTFRDFLKHETGFTQKGVDHASPNTLQMLEDAMGIDVPADTSFNYNNANFGIFRVLIPRLADYDFDAFPGYSEEELYAGFFVFTALNIFENVDASVTCNLSQPVPTVYYGVPDDGLNGLQALADYSEQCGAYGFVASAEDLGAIFADLQGGDDLISDDSFTAMKEGQLGFFDPANFPYFWGNGGLGIYHNHGGDRYSENKGLDACIMLYPNGVSASLLINSNGGNYGGFNLYQCDLLRNAFDNAWEPI